MAPSAPPPLSHVCVCVCVCVQDCPGRGAAGRDAGSSQRQRPRAVPAHGPAGQGQTGSPQEPPQPMAEHPGLQTAGGERKWGEGETFHGC